MIAADCTTLVELLRARADGEGDRSAYGFLADGERVSADISCGALDRMAAAIAHSIRSRVEPGTPVVLAYPAGLEFVAAFFGCLYAGAIAVPMLPVHPRRGNERLAAIVADCGARVLLSTPAGVRAFEAAREHSPALAALDALSPDAELDRSFSLTMPAPDALAFLQYTSGSTQSPRGVRISHANVLANLAAIHAAEGNGAHSRSLSWLPHYHDMGLIEGILQPLYGGHRALLMAHTAFLQRPVRWLQAISAHRISVSGGPNFAFDLCVRRVRDDELGELDLSCWEVAYCGAEPVRARTLEAFAERFGACGFKRRALRPVYGLAESTLLVTASDRHAPGPKLVHASSDGLEQNRYRSVASGSPGAVALVCCGRPVAGAELAIVDASTATELEPGSVGEIWLSGPSVASGYFGEPPAGNLVFEECMLGGARRRWLKTGDLGFMVDGELVVSGRVKDLIIVRGRKLHPQDLEQTAEACHRSILPNGAAAFALEEEGTEGVALCVEIAQSLMHAFEESCGSAASALAGTIREAVSRRHELRLTTVAFVRPLALARTSSGKLMRYRCREDFLRGRLALLGRFDMPAVGAPTRAALALAE
jgi:acyl-CoA synthetase (AMP-forming)/AMP-acid ligase II